MLLDIISKHWQAFVFFEQQKQGNSYLNHSALLLQVQSAVPSHHHRRRSQLQKHYRKSDAEYIYIYIYIHVLKHRMEGLKDVGTMAILA